MEKEKSYNTAPRAADWKIQSPTIISSKKMRMKELLGKYKKLAETHNQWGKDLMKMVINLSMKQELQPSAQKLLKPYTY